MFLLLLAEITSPRRCIRGQWLASKVLVVMGPKKGEKNTATTSRMCRHDPFEMIDPQHLHVGCGVVADIINCAFFF